MRRVGHPYSQSMTVTMERPPLQMVRKTVLHTSSFFPSAQDSLWDPRGPREGVREKRDGAEQKGGVGGAVSYYRVCLPLTLSLWEPKKRARSAEQQPAVGGEEHETESEG